MKIKSASFSHRGRLLVSSAVAYGLASSMAFAQDTPRTTNVGATGTEPGSGEIIVTARRRNESALSSPVVLSAVSGTTLREQAITGLQDISRIVPQLVVGDSQSVQGGSISLRGIGSSESNPFADQAVAFNMDGVQVARATVQRMAQMDLEQVAVYKGPQALFFGKNSPAGVIDIRSADPTRQFDSQASIGYDYVGGQAVGDGYLSGPLTDDLSARLALYGSDLAGYAYNVAPPGRFNSPTNREAPHDREFAGRLTLKYEPGSQFSARFKVAYDRLRTDGPAENQQIINCPTGTSQLGNGPQDCKIDDKVVHPNLGPNFAMLDPRYGDGVPYLRQSQVLSSLEMNYLPSDALKITSTTGFYHSQTSYLDTLNGAVNPALLLANYQALKDTEFSQELRAATQMKGPVNAIVGAYYQHVQLDDVFLAAYNANTPISLYNNAATQRGNAYSLFGQLTIKLASRLELSGGARYSHEEKTYDPSAAGVPIATAVPKRDFHNVSPEATLTWHPTANTNLFGSYKQGFLSGGFNAGAVNAAADQSYGQEEIKGGEIGAKASLFDRRLRVNAAIYDYVLTGLQVQTQVGITQVVANAGKATTRGAEGDFAWTTPVTGLSLNGALAYNHARYDVYAATCYAGQTIAMGCDLNPGSTGAYRAENLAGQPLARAPNTIVSGGFDYHTPVSATVEIGFNGDASHSASYFANPSDQMASLQSAYWLFDAGARVGARDGAWQLALIGRNLGNKLYITRANDVTFTGGGTGTAKGVLADVSAVPSRGREILVRLTIKPNLWSH